MFSLGFDTARFSLWKCCRYKGARSRSPTEVLAFLTHRASNCQVFCRIRIKPRMPSIGTHCDVTSTFTRWQRLSTSQTQGSFQATGKSRKKYPASDGLSLLERGWKPSNVRTSHPGREMLVVTQIPKPPRITVAITQPQMIKCDGRRLV
jgi:hypothetical protein